MKDFDEQGEERLDRALRLVGSAATPEGMEERVLRRVQARPVAVRASVWTMGRLAAAGGLVAVLVVATSLAVGHRGTSATDSVATSMVPARGGGGARAAGDVPLVGEGVTPAGPDRRVVRRVDLRMVRRVAARPRRAGAGEVRGSMRVISFPAPVAPLTEQERLLMTAVRLQQAPVIEALDPVRRAAAEAEDERRFESFVASVRHGGI